MLCLERTRLRTKLARNTRVVLPGRVEDRSVRAAAYVYLWDLKALALAEELHIIPIVLVRQGERLIDGIELNKASQHRSI